MTASTENPRRDRATSWLLTLYVALTSAGMVGSYVLATRASVPPFLPVIFALASGIALLFAFHLAEKARTRGATVTVPATVWASVIASHLVLVLLPPLLSDDVWRYLFDGLMQRHGLHPWAYPPASPKVADLTALLQAPVNQGHLRSVYPPFAELLFAANAWLGHSLLMWKSAMLSCAFATAALISRRFGQFPALLFLGHPLTLLAVSSEGHVDSVGILLLYAAVVVPMAFWKRGALFGAAIATKLIPLFALPALLAREREQWLRAGVVVAATMVLVAIPYIPAGADSVQTLGTYLTSWSFNGSVAPVGIYLLSQVLDLFISSSTFELTPMTALNQWLDRSTIYAGHASFQSWWTVPQLAERLYRGFSLLGLGVVALLAARRVFLNRWSLHKGTLIALLAWLLLSPVVHPWYVLWVLPLSFGSGRAGMFSRVWSVAVLVSYLTPARYLLTGDWSQPLIEPLIEYGVLVVAAAAIWRPGSSSRPPPHRHTERRRHRALDTL